MLLSLSSYERKVSVFLLRNTDNSERTSQKTVSFVTMAGLQTHHPIILLFSKAMVPQYVTPRQPA
jgi:hypothetical protein